MPLPGNGILQKRIVPDSPPTLHVRPGLIIFAPPAGRLIPACRIFPEDVFHPWCQPAAEEIVRFFG
jgi:hypothetical protein